MRRGSLIAPLVLIAIGALFLINNLNPGLSVFATAGRYWPYILIGWGVLRALEILYTYQQGRRLPTAGLSGGEWFLAVFLAFVGMGITGYSGFRDGFFPGRITMRGLDMFGESFDYPLSASIPAGDAKRILIDNLRGNARIVGTDSAEVQVNGRTTVRAFDESDAKRVGEQAKLTLVSEGGQIVLRTNQAQVSNDQRISSDLDISVPKGFSVECRGRYGDFDISTVTGDVDVRSGNAGVRLEDIGGAVRIDLGRSDIVRAIRIKGSVDIKGRGSDLELDDVQGPVTVLAPYYGELQFRNIASQMRYESANSTILFERIPGYVRLSGGDLTATKVIGPARISSENKDVRISEFTNSLDIDVKRGDVELFPGTDKFGRISVTTRNGDIDFGLPAGTNMHLQATTDRGEIENDFDPALKEDRRDRGATLEGTPGAGPEVKLKSGRGTITIRKAMAGEHDWDTSETPREPRPTRAPRPPVPPRVTNQ